MTATRVLNTCPTEWRNRSESMWEPVHICSRTDGHLSPCVCDCGDVCPAVVVRSDPLEDLPRGCRALLIGVALMLAALAVVVALVESWHPLGGI